MNLLVVGTIFTVLGLGPLVDATGVAGLRGLPEDETSCLAVVKAALAEYRVLYEQSLKDSPNLMDAKSDVPQKAVPTEEHKEIMPANITNGGLVTEKKEQLSPQESTIVTSVERKNVTEKDDGLQKVERTEEIKEIMPGNITNEVLVKQKEEQLSPQESTIVTSVERKNVTEKDDGLQNVERTEEIKEIMTGNITNEVLVKQKEEQLSPQESTKVTSVERKNVTEKGDGKDVEKETVIQKEVEKNVCDSDIKEVRNEKHLNETIEDLKHQVDDVKNKIKEEKAKAEETNATRSPCVVKEPSAAPVIQDGKVVEKIVPAVTPAKVAEKIHPTMTEGKVPVVTKEKVVEQAAPSVTEEIVSISKEQENVPVMAEEKKVIEKIIPSVTEGKVPVVPQQEVVEKVAPSPTEEKVPVVTQERAVEQNAPQERVIEQAAPQERVIEQAAPQERVIEQAAPQERVIEQAAPQERAVEQNAPQERVIEQAAPTATEEIVTVSKEKEEVPVVVTEEKVPDVTNETVIEKITPSVTEEKDANQRKVVSYEDASENQENQVTGDEETDKTELKFIVTIQERIVREQTVSIIPVMDKGANKRANGKLVKKAMKRVAMKVARAVLEELSREHSTDGEGQ
ncbi:probable serine/threonine-protein kinase kinX isoform X11 [Eriocheir sinensis]|uniref:probable serine/threonine-protein kinase kinX isoform X11 n=1 Tax=Eriocheir sinensis TaxID=95602 RepID=UPI0021C8D923|nr:probable serine/threonine-protein kinase kinX isoform X11 [Eriocheir sinensis]